MGRSEMRTKFWFGCLKGRDHMEDLGKRRWEDDIKMNLDEIGWVYTGFI
jgi:hypothetical protein